MAEGRAAYRGARLAAVEGLPATDPDAHTSRRSPQDLARRRAGAAGAARARGPVAPRRQEN
jgi:hypothetical protein